MDKYNIMQINSKIKLIIWDLDETFWKGTLSEEGVILKKNTIKIIKELTNRGIMNSICSKNNYNLAKNKLEEICVWDYFVFPCISWSPKGKMVHKIIKNMQLRDVNVIFIDDNHMNLEEVKFYNPNINILLPTEISKLLNNKYLEGKKDSEHTRLKHYKILEKKFEDKSNFSSNEEFLAKSDINIIIKEDCKNNIIRIHELITRTNQLNFTKERISKAEVLSIINSDNYITRYIRVQDKYGDYGIVGFYVLNKAHQKLEHFVFSCRILNLGIAQWVYSFLDFPEIEINGEVAIELVSNYTPNWIKLNKNVSKKRNNNKSNINCFVRGGCDLNQLIHYLNMKSISLITEFNYQSKNGINIHREHSEILRSIDELKDMEKRYLISELPFYDNDIFKTEIFDKDYDVVILSVLMDYTQGLYRHKRKGNLKVAYGDFKLPLRLSNKDRIRNLDSDFLKKFSANYEFIGPISKDRFRANLEYIRKNLKDKTLLLLINGSEIELKHNLELDRHLHHKEMNQVLNNFINGSDNTFLIDVNKFITSSNDVLDNIRHYRRKIYKEISDEIVSIINKEISISTKKSLDVIIKNKIKDGIGNIKEDIKIISRR